MAIDILHMVVYAANGRSAAERTELELLCRDFLTQITWPDLGDADRLDSELEQIIAFATEQSASFADMQALLDRAADARTLNPRYRSGTSGQFFTPIIRRYPSETLSHIFGRQVPEDGRLASDLIFNESSANNEDTEEPVVPDDELLAWCAADVANRSLFAARIAPLSVPKNGTPSLLNKLFALAPDQPEFISAIAERCMRGGLADGEDAYMLCPTNKVLSRQTKFCPGDGPSEGSLKRRSRSRPRHRRGLSNRLHRIQAVAGLAFRGCSRELSIHRGSNSFLVQELSDLHEQEIRACAFQPHLRRPREYCRRCRSCPTRLGAHHSSLSAATLDLHAWRTWCTAPGASGRTCLNTSQEWYPRSTVHGRHGEQRRRRADSVCVGHPFRIALITALVLTSLGSTFALGGGSGQ